MRRCFYACAIAQTAILFGIPVSFNEIIVSSVVGSGYVAGTDVESREKIINTVLAWTGSLTLSIVAGYTILWIVLLVL